VAKQHPRRDKSKMRQGQSGRTAAAVDAVSQGISQQKVGGITRTAYVLNRRSRIQIVRRSAMEREQGARRAAGRGCTRCLRTLQGMRRSQARPDQEWDKVVAAARKERQRDPNTKQSSRRGHALQDA